ncbi:MAG: PrsW family glutamic-type intramembrane protease [Candidatus Eisenbacteria bacterium]
MGLLTLSLGFVPVVLFLFTLRVLDSYKLVHRGTLLGSLAVGVVAAGIAFGTHRLVLVSLHPDPVLLRHWLAPVIEESLKAAFVAWMIRTERVGFTVDAAIVGFAVGTGFALTENLYYAGALRDTSLGLWLVRGLGTAIMHGSTTAVFAIVSKDLGERHSYVGPHLLLPGLALAIAVHSAYNHLTWQPLMSTALLLVTMPILLIGAFERSERATRAWLGSGLDGEVEMLEQILDGEVAGTRVGQYLESIRAHFPGLIVADMLCLLRIHLELSIRAKGLLIARSAGVDVPIGAQVRANLEELRFLERAIGPTGRLALLPLRRSSSRDLWQIMLLAREAARG